MCKSIVKRLAMTTFSTGANLRARLIVQSLVVLFVVAGCAPLSAIHAQYCNPAVVNYIVRDEKGNVVGADELKSVYEQLPKSIGDARIYAGECSLADDGRTFYWPESADWSKGQKLPSLQFINNETCKLSLVEITLIYHDKRMRLIFNIEIARTQADRRPLIDSLPFQEGTFALDLTGWSHDVDKIIPADRWKLVKDKGTADHLKSRLSVLPAPSAIHRRF